MNFKVTFVIAVLLACVLTTSGLARRRRIAARIGSGVAQTGGELIAGQALESSTGGGSWSPWTKWNQQRKMENAMNDEMDAELLLNLLKEE
uniref:Ci-META6 n=1 Tax=Ciona intestinalis TaxID=7719 RepID=Q8WST0_CIOIN|nr:Ci-META6 precursor [Ciona intestinalis]BAB79625.1 Ci-META6 [Ciona intestinalis]|eukprot:NP_001027617.1 Ci-META6 precursor [Ciona intestinalis]